MKFEDKTVNFNGKPLYDTQVYNEELVPQIRPWVRFWARYMDIFLYIILTALVLSLLSPTLYDVLLNPFGMILLLFIYVFVEAILISTWGTTPGKWLLSVQLTTQEGKMLTFSDALNRSFLVWFRGLIIGFPLVMILTEIYSYYDLKDKGVTYWDNKLSTKVSHKKIGFFRTIVAIMFFILYAALGVL